MQHKKIVVVALIIVSFMFAFSFALSPLYNVFCKATGLNGRVALIKDATKNQPVVLNRAVTVQFVTINNANLTWDFYPTTTEVEVHPEEIVKVIFMVKNNTKRAMTVQAIPSITPGPAVLYFHKIECFCFDKQYLAAGEIKAMPMVFRIDKKIPEDINTISLAYTLFDISNHNT